LIEARPSEANRADSNGPVNATTRANKASGLRQAIALVVVLVLGVVAWVVLGTDYESTLDLAPQRQSAQENSQSGGHDNGINQPPAVIPNQDAGAAALAANPPSDAGTQQSTARFRGTWPNGECAAV
jgi:hypothetical protein